MNTNERPTWWHPKGATMKVRLPPGNNKNVVFLANVMTAELLITPLSGKRRFIVTYKVRHPQAETGGKLDIEDSELSEMFGLKDLDLSRETKGQFWRRHKAYLNIPRAGDGTDGDPNLSILVTAEIQDAIRKLMGGDI